MRKYTLLLLTFSIIGLSIPTVDAKRKNTASNGCPTCVKKKTAKIKKNRSHKKKMRHDRKKRGRKSKTHKGKKRLHKKQLAQEQAAPCCRARRDFIAQGKSFYDACKQCKAAAEACCNDTKKCPCKKKCGKCARSCQDSMVAVTHCCKEMEGTDSNAIDRAIKEVTICTKHCKACDNACKKCGESKQCCATNIKACDACLFASDNFIATAKEYRDMDKCPACK